MKSSLVLLGILVSLLAGAQSYEIDASALNEYKLKMLPFSDVNPAGERLAANNRYFLKNDKPWFPLMGEMHYNRVPPQDWEAGILKMKSAGLSIIATYVFWNEHETAPGVWDWKNNRDLRRFTALCAKHGMYVWARIGPWSHGEQLHGGHPEWIAKMKGNRSNDAAYMKASAKLYQQIGKQLQGLYFKNGGPVIGIQLENEYASGEAGHISKLKSIALEAGMQPVFWSVTANTVFDDSKKEVMPLQGSYCYRGWEKGGGGPTADFLYGDDQWIMTDALGKVFYDVDAFPRGLCEQGAGSQMTYKNRFIVEPNVEEAHLQNQVGRGMNLVGYYMFHGGTQTPGLKEPGYPESYDFQAPVGEFGWIRPSYNYLKILHHFINDFGSLLAPMQQVEASNPVRDVTNTEELRYIVRTKDNSGFLFLNNTQVRIPMPDKNVAVSVKLKKEIISFPAISLKGQTNLVLPFNFKINDVLIKYASAQLMAKIEDRNTTMLFFIKPDNVDPVIAFDPASLDAASPGIMSPVKLAPGSGLSVISKTGKHVTIVTLTRKEAEQSWRTSINGKEVLIVTNANVLSNGKKLQLRQTGSNIFKLRIYPGDAAGLESVKVTGGVKGMFRDYVASVPAYRLTIPFTFNAGKATINLPGSLPGYISDVFFKVSYRGSAATVSKDGKVLTDHLFNGIPWMLGIKNYLDKSMVQIDVQKWEDGITGVDSALMQRMQSGNPAIEKIETLPEYKFDILF